MSEESTKKIVKMEKCTTGWVHFLTREELEARQSPTQKKLNEELKRIWGRRLTKAGDSTTK